MADYFPPKPFDYAAFIDVLRDLQSTAMQWDTAQPRSADAIEFRAWKLRLEDALRDVRALGYRPTCGIESRQFRVISMGGVPLARDAKRFDRDLVDTLLEIDLLVENFRRHGAPRNPKVDQPAAEPSTIVLHEVVNNAIDSRPTGEPQKWPDKPTMAWLWHNMPAAAWLVLASSFGLGFAVASWEPIKSGLAKWSQSEIGRPVLPAAANLASGPR